MSCNDQPACASSFPLQDVAKNGVQASILYVHHPQNRIVGNFEGHPQHDKHLFELEIRKQQMF